MEKVKPQLSLFENKNCQVCGVEVPNNQVTCHKCAKEWVESITLEGYKVFKDVEDVDDNLLADRRVYYL